MRLERSGLILVALTFDPREDLKAFISGGIVTPEKLSVFFRDFANMLEAGLGVEHILATLRDTGGDLRLVAAAARISDELSGGRPLAGCFETAGCFPRLALMVLSAGEKAGNLPQVMGLLAEHFELAAELRGKCFGALVYPAVILLFLLAVFVYVSGFVVPQFAPLLPAQALQEPLTRIMLGASALIREAWPLLLAGAAALCAGAAGFMRCCPRVWESFLGFIPFVGPAQKDLWVSLCFFDLFILLKSGVSLEAALNEAAGGAEGPAQKGLATCRELLAEGHTFSGALQAAGYFPRLVVETVRLGEETGRYDDYCGRVFQFYRRSFAERVRVMAALLHPLMLGLCASFVAVMALAFLKPIYANLTQIGTIQQ